MVGRVFLGRYQAIRLLGEGGMGRVYLARQLDLGRQVVVKVMHDHLISDTRFCERFQRETLLMARFQHPYAVTLYDASLNDPQGPCIIMEHIKGVTLDMLRLQNKGRLSPGRVGRLLGQLGEVLQAAHAAGIVHRDLKPANLMVVDPDTPYEKIKVMDFGLAKLMDAPLPKEGAASGADFAVGTPQYICPEQVRGEPTDHRSDIYSLGIVLYELLTGRTPFGVDSTMDLLLAHATEEPLPFAHNGTPSPVSPAVEAVVMSCLAKDPADRPPTARDVAERFTQALTQPQASESSVELPTDIAAASGPTSEEQTDPTAVHYRLEAWMPESVAVHKLHGFMHDAGGEVLESVPGRVRFRLGGSETPYEFTGGRGSWFRGRKTGLVEIDMRMFQTGSDRQNQLGIAVAVRPLDGCSPFDPAWRDHTARVFCDLRAYLMGQSEAARSPV